MTIDLKVSEQSLFKSLRGRAAARRSLIILLRAKAVERKSARRREDIALVAEMMRSFKPADILTTPVQPEPVQSTLVGPGGTSSERSHAEPEAGRTDMAAFLKGFGCLKGKEVFGGDAVEFQREMRDEWQ